jgi:hypothetical protein
MAVSLIVAKFIEPGQQTNKPTNQQTNKPTNQQTNKPINQQTNKPTKQDKQTNRQTELAHYPVGTNDSFLITQGDLPFGLRDAKIFCTNIEKSKCHTHRLPGFCG